MAGAALVTLAACHGAKKDRENRDAGANVSAARASLAPEGSFPRIDAANAARNAGNLEEARAQAEGVLAASPAAPEEERALAEGVLARVALRQGDLTLAERRFRESIAAHAAAGRIRARAEDSFALAFLLSQRAHRLSEARAVLDALEPDLAHYPEGAARIFLYRLQLAIAGGDVRGALEAARAASERCERLGLHSAARRARLGEVVHLTAIGDLDGARALLQRHGAELERDPEASACEKAEYAAGIVDVETVAAHPSEDARRAAARVLSLSEGACPDAALRAYALTRLAALAAGDGLLEEAESRLREARATMKELRLAERLLGDDVEGRIALAGKRPREGLAAFERERDLARRSLLVAEEQRAEVGRGRALEALGKAAEAEGAYRAAEDLLARHALEIPLGEGRGVLLAGKAESSGRLIDLLVQRGRAAEALEVARDARARELAGLARAHRVGALDGAGRAAWEKEISRYGELRQAIDDDVAQDWKRGATELHARLAARAAEVTVARSALDRALALLGPTVTRAARPLAAGDVLLAYVATPSGTLGLVAIPSGVRAFPVDPPAIDAPATAFAESLLAPAKPELGSARRVFVLAGGAVRDVPVHALPFEGAPLLAHALVLYPLDLGAPVRTDPRGGLLVATDPLGDLAGADREGATLEEQLSGAGAARLITRLSRESASAPRVRSALAAASLFHFAGHATFGGHDGLESGLRLAEGATLDAGDILAAPHVPARVVLDACDAARGDPRASFGAFGFAQAFVASGSAIVLAASRPIADGAGVPLAKALYPGFADAADDDSALQAARRALLAMAAANAGDSWSADWAAFRILVP
ncbi:MAG TPA: CHAT domain-containing protein [Polyangiaceae bacterium]